MTKRELIENASAKAETIFRALGEVPTIWHVVTRDGQQVFLPPPLFARDKDHSTAMVRAALEAMDAVAFVFVDEAWMRVINAKTDSPEGRAALAYTAAHGVRNHPDRIEVVMFSAEDELGGLTAWRRIVRKVNSRPQLGPLEIKDDFVAQEGRLVGMLPHRGTTH